MRIADHRLHSEGAPVPFRTSPNRGGPLQARFLVMHYTAGRSAESSVGWLTNPEAKASAHLVIGKDGLITQLVPFDVIAWHAGVSSWHDGQTRLTGMNQHSIGIELDNPGRLVRQGAHWRSLHLGTTYESADVIEATHKNENHSAGWHVYPAAQLEAAFAAAAALVATYDLKDVIGHDDIAPERKSDPGPAFPMENFRARLFGRSETHDLSLNAATAPLNLRIGPGTQFPTIPPSPLPIGTRMRVLGRDGSWRRVDVLDVVAGINDLQGWVHANFLRTLV